MIGENLRIIQLVQAGLVSGICLDLWLVADLERSAATTSNPGVGFIRADKERAAVYILILAISLIDFLGG